MNYRVKPGTVARTAVLLLTLINLLLSAFGKSPLPIENEQLEQLITNVSAIVAALVSWWYNNSYTQEALAADSYRENLLARKEK